MSKKTKPAEPVQSYHFFGSNAMHWATGYTREEVLAKLAKATDADWIKNSVASDDGGLYVWTVRVETPRAVTYPLESFAPVGVPLSHAREYLLLSKKDWCEVVPASIPLEQCTVNKSRNALIVDPLGPVDPTDVPTWDKVES